jgi:3-oxoacyl-[acyl-carrier protein] reductase
MNDRVVIVTGGARRIGRAVALSLADLGWRAAICYRSSEDDARTTAEALAAKGVDAFAERCDVSHAAQCEAFVGKVLARWGRVDALVNGAGPYVREPLLDTSVDRWHAMFSHCSG